MSRQWYPHYSGDYMRNTGHLSLLEDGAYRRLLDHYYSTGKPLPANASRLHRICRAFAHEEKEAVDFVASEFFHLNGDELHNNRADRELEKANDISAIRSKAAHKMHDAKAHAKAHASADKKGAKAHTTTTTTTTIGKQPQKKIMYDPDFILFWEAYPKKTGKGGAFASWKRIASKPSIEVIIKSVKEHETSDQWGEEYGRFIPNPSTWINQRRWEDEIRSIPDSDF